MQHRITELIILKRWIEEGARDVRVAGLSGTIRAFFLAHLLMDMGRSALLVLPQAKDASRFYRQLAFFLPPSMVENSEGQRRLYDFPIYDLSPLSGLSPHREIVTRRLQALYTLTSMPNPIVVTSTEALLLRTLPKESLIHALEYLEAGEEVEREKLLEKLEACGYLRTSLVEERGDYSIRGGVIDIFPPLYEFPIRLEFWGDRLESIRYFDPLTQRSTGHLREAVVLPASEILRGKENIRRARGMGRMPSPLEGGASFSGQEGWLNHFYPRLDTLLDFFPPQGLLILVEATHIQTEMNRFTQKFFKDLDRFRLEAEDRKMPFPETEGILEPAEGILKGLEGYQQIQLSELEVKLHEEPIRSLRVTCSPTGEMDFNVRLAGRGKVSMVPLAEKISLWLGFGARVVVVCRTEQQAQRLGEILQNYGVKVDDVVNQWGDVSPGKGLTICLGRLARGFAWPELGLYILSEDEIFGPKKSRATARSDGKGLNWASFSQLKEGNLVVHQDHGIGRYGGLCKMEIEQKINEFVIIEYVNNDRLYIPADRISILQKYVGVDDQNPKLDQLGGSSWDLAKRKAKGSIQEIAKQLVEIYALRNHRKGFSFSPPDHYYREFEATFEHEETPDQIKVIDEVLADMGSERPMDRLICGDVGFGKTEVAIRASFKSVMDGKQAAVLVPTTVLAEQHHENFKKRMDPYQINVGVISRFKTGAEQKEILAKVRSKKIDILIGTHRILQKDVQFADLGLLIIDEEHRFGVKQKEAIKRYRSLVDVLALTATPIPRTLHMSLLGVRDLSLIETPPEDRLAIQTYISPFDESTIRRAIESELERGGQIFFVHNRVQTIEDMADRLATLVPQARFAIAHGQMNERELEQTMVRFHRKEIDVLVCTTIIESGLDIPSTNTIIINEAERFGLAQIYQLRGRVGRSQENAYAYLLISDRSSITREAEKRLKALMDFSNLGAGIHLALHDLKIRGGGNILGYTQSGHITAIGYELYLKMVEQTIAEMKGEEWREEINPEINVNMPAYLPGEYVADTDVRLNLYRRMSHLREVSELDSITREMSDRFGPLPEEVSNLLLVMAVRLGMKTARVNRLDVTEEGLIFTLPPDTLINPEAMVRLIAMSPRRFQFLSEKKFRVTIDARTPRQALLDAKRFIDKLQSMVVAKDHGSGPYNDQGIKGQQ